MIYKDGEENMDEELKQLLKIEMEKRRNAPNQDREYNCNVLLKTLDAGLYEVFDALATVLSSNPHYKLSQVQSLMITEGEIKEDQQTANIHIKFKQG